MADDDLNSEREFNKHDIAEFRSNGGKVGGQFEGFPLLILTSTGAKSGEQRENLIGYFDIDDKVYVVGSAAAATPPRLGVQPARAARRHRRDRVRSAARRHRTRITPSRTGTASTGSSSSARPGSASTRRRPTG